MNKFKFGDIVRHKGSGEIFVAGDFDESDGFIVAMSKETATVWDVKADELELIPHPDTARLDYMGKLVAGSMGVQYDPTEHRQQIDRSMSNN